MNTLRPKQLLQLQNAVDQYLHTEQGHQQEAGSNPEAKQLKEIMRIVRVMNSALRYGRAPVDSV